MYVSNEEPIARDFYFDDLRIVHKQSIFAQTDSYYPFGLSHGNMSYVRERRMKNQFLYNGKELVEDFDLGWYDYGARYYAADLGRWHAVDPLADTFAIYTPYNYVFNNPLLYIDPDGRSGKKSLYGLNGGQTIINNSNSPIVIKGSGGIKLSLDSQPKEWASSTITLEPGQSLVPESVSILGTEDGMFAIYSGSIIDNKTGEKIEEVGIFDVDGVIIQDDQVFKDENGMNRTTENTNTFGGGWHIKISSGLANGALEIFNPISEFGGSVEIFNNEDGTISLQAKGIPLVTKPYDISYGESE